MNSSPVIAVYGAYGHTGRLVLSELGRQGFAVRALGRDGARLAEVAGAEGVEWRAARIDDAASLDAALQGTGAVVLCAGPFDATAGPMLDAALRRRIPYFDTAAEPEVVKALFDSRSAAAADAGVAAVQCVGYFGALVDWAVERLSRDLPRIDAIQVAHALEEWVPTAGSRNASAKISGRRFVVENSRLELRQGRPPLGDHEFGGRFGAQKVLSEYPGPEIMLLHRRTGAPSIRMAMRAAGLRRFAEGTHATPAADLRNGAFRIEVRVEGAGTTRFGAFDGTDMYAVTAPIVAHTVRAVLSRGQALRGVLTPAQAAGADAALSSLAAAGVAFASDAESGSNAHD